ncbi:MAG: Mrp/NBP35 family ATP-binding protein [Chloroflexi bacterium]|nr:Mrp/NBP35 family ATP-binding protein [Chloroflexota bacterium]
MFGKGKKNGLTRDAVLQALGAVQEPELHRDLVSLKMIHDLEVEGGRVRFTLMLTTPACPLKDVMKRDIDAALGRLPGFEALEIKWDARVPADGRNRGLLDLPIKNAVAVASGKGGVGKTTVAVNVAVSLAQAGAAVGLLDADIYGPNVPMMMGLTRMPPPRNDKMVPALAYGVRVMSIGFLVKADQPLIWRGPMLHSAIRQFLTDVSWGELDYLIIDLPPGTGDAQLSLCQSLPLTGGVIVTLPQAVSQADARRGLEMFRQLQVQVLGVVENMSYLTLPDGTEMDLFGRGGGEELARASGVSFIGAIPMDPEVRKGGDAGVPIVTAFPESAAARALVAVAQDIAAKVSVAALQQQQDFIPIQMLG